MDEVCDAGERCENGLLCIDHPEFCVGIGDGLCKVRDYWDIDTAM